MTFDLKHKIALVTGSGKKTGIGYGIVHKLATCGANVVLADLVGKEIRQNEPAADNLNEMKILARHLGKKFKVKAFAVALDVTRGDSIAQMADQVQKQFGRIDILCNNAGAGVRVNAICPGVIQTDFTAWRFKLEAEILDSTVSEREAEMLKTIPMGRLGSTDEVADLVAFLASDQSSYITGQAINITGGAAHGNYQFLVNRYQHIR